MVMEIRKALFEKVAFELWSEDGEDALGKKGRENIQDSDDSIYKGPVTGGNMAQDLRRPMWVEHGEHQKA